METKIRFTFGRMRLVHQGHLNLVDQVDIIGLSNKSKETNSKEVLEKLVLHKEARYAQTISELINSFPSEAQLELVLGEDQEKFGQGMVKAFPNRLSLKLLSRPEGAPSSTMARAAISAGHDLVQLGLARDACHAELLIEQYRLEQNLLM